jgi:hypothetical protein
VNKNENGSGEQPFMSLHILQKYFWVVWNTMANESPNNSHYLKTWNRTTLNIVTIAFISCDIHW